MPSYNDPLVPYNSLTTLYGSPVPPPLIPPVVVDPVVVVVPPRTVSLDVQMVVPFLIDSAGGISATTDTARIDHMAVMTLLATQPGERAMRPGYGVPTRELLFEADNPIIAQVLATGIQEAAVQYAPEITVTDVKVSPDDKIGDGTAVIDIGYRPASNRLDTSSSTLRTTVSAEEG